MSAAKWYHILFRTLHAAMFACSRYIRVCISTFHGIPATDVFSCLAH